VLDRSSTCLEMARVAYVALYTSVDLPPPDRFTFWIFLVRLDIEQGVTLKKAQQPADRASGSDLHMIISSHPNSRQALQNTYKKIQ
jgi:hypothetical protein